MNVWFQEMDHTQSKPRKCFMVTGSMAGIDKAEETLE